LVFVFVDFFNLCKLFLGLVALVIGKDVINNLALKLLERLKAVREE